MNLVSEGKPVGVLTLALCCALLVVPSAGAQADAKPARPCSSPAYRQFDFWIGDWDVRRVGNDERPPAHNRISSVQGGCVILEEYDTPGGYTGISISYYDSAAGRWSQTWMDNQGVPILHSGGVRDGSMVLVDDPSGSSINRTTWTPQKDGTVRQHWEKSDDGGKSWSTLFDGIYHRRGSSD